ncbi:MAG TPA: EamA family transporter RarD [Kineosporiaceae bacterium]
MNHGRRGAGYGITAYLIWGIFPLYFHALRRSGAVEILLHRVLWSLVVCLGVLTVGRAWPQVRAALHRRHDAALLATASALLAVNWGVYVYAVNSGQVLEASLGYYINPLVTVLFGVLALRERLRPVQWAAVGTGGAAVAVLTGAYGRLPWIALALALSFGGYGLIKNRVGGSVGALASLSVETLTLAPVAIAGVVWLQATGRGTFTDDAPAQGLLLASAGLATVVPLLFFAAAARRVPLSTMGLLQYLTPTLQLICGVVFLGEHMPLARWLGFGLVWIALALLTADSLTTARRRTPSRFEAPATAASP